MTEAGSQLAIPSGTMEGEQDTALPIQEHSVSDACNSAVYNPDVSRKRSPRFLYTHPTRWFIPTPPFRRNTSDRHTPRRTHRKEGVDYGNVNNEIIRDAEHGPDTGKNPRISLPMKTVLRQSSYSVSVRRQISPGRMNKEGVTGTLMPNAFSRLLFMNSAEGDTDGLGDLPGPGRLEPIRVGHKYAASSRKPKGELFKRTRTICFLGSLLALFLILIEIIFMLFSLSMGKPCRVVSSLIVSVSLLAICIIIIEWIKSWLFRESSPMWLMPQKKSTITETNAQLVMLASALQSPVTSGPLSPINQEAGTNKSGAFDRPKLEIHDVLKSEPEDVYEGGGGLRGRIADYRRFDVASCIASLFLLILYIVACILLLRGLVTTIPNTSAESNTHSPPESDSISNIDKEPVKCADEYYTRGFNFVVFNLVMIGLRAVLFLTSEACTGICLICGSRNTSENEVPMVTNNTLSGFLPHLRKHDESFDDQYPEE